MRELKIKPIHGSYSFKMPNSSERYPHIVEKICHEIKEVLPDKSIQILSLIRAKDGVFVYRGILDEQPVVIKYFEKEGDRREISNYRLLNELNIPTMQVMAYGTCCIVLEDIDFSCRWRLGKEEDLKDEAVALRLARWYFDFHEKGYHYEGLDKMYRETDCITEYNLKLLCNKLPQAKDTFDYIIRNLESLNKLVSEITDTFNYNDFYWTNLLVSKDKSAAMPFDYNLLGAGSRYNDIRNVSYSLSEKARTVFINEYNRQYEEKHGYSRFEEEFREQQIYEVTSILFSLITACQRENFPSWANAPRDAAIKGELLKNARILFEKSR